jgi:hypothetical protein
VFYTNVEQHVYKLICGSKCKEPIECIVDLLLSAMLRTHCEAAAESMGNIINNVLGDRKLDNVDGREFLRQVKEEGSYSFLHNIRSRRPCKKRSKREV